MTRPQSIFFVLSRAEHSRMWRRIEHIRPLIAQSRVAAFERTCSPVLHCHSYELLGRLTHRKLFERVPILIRAAWSCLRPVNRCDVCYAFGLDMLLLLWTLKTICFSRTKLVYEIADIHPALCSKSMMGALMRFMERFLIRRSALVVLTSPAFKTGYFAEVQKFVDFKSIVIEHKVALPTGVRDRVSRHSKLDSRISIGYIGLLKSIDSFDILCRLAEEGDGRIQVGFHGRFVAPLDKDTCLDRIEASEHLAFHGPYRSPEGLEEVYEPVDVVWDAYHEGENARWQRTTRFSEACYFKRPVIYNPNTQDGQIAEKYELGLPMSFDDPDKCIADILSIDQRQWDRWFENMNSLPGRLLYYDNEYNNLIKLVS